MIQTWHFRDPQFFVIFQAETTSGPELLAIAGSVMGCLFEVIPMTDILNVPSEEFHYNEWTAFERSKCTLVYFGSIVHQKYETLITI